MHPSEDRFPSVSCDTSSAYRCLCTQNTERIQQFLKCSSRAPKKMKWSLQALWR
jgi:hypothetical protein